MVGSVLGHPEVTGLRGSGGVDEVYQAADTKLGRSTSSSISLLLNWSPER